MEILLRKAIYGIFCLLLGTPFILKSQNAPICATPGADGSYNYPSPINTFFPGSNDDIVISEGATQVTLDAVPDPFLVGTTTYNFGINQIEKGSLLLIIQMQGAAINSSDSDVYGSGSAANGGSGYTDIDDVGRYEYIVALNDVPLTGGVLQFRGAGDSGGLIYAYENASATSTSGQKRFQVVRLMQFSNLVMTQDMRTTPWNGRAGGIIAFDVAGTLDFNGYVIDASMTGFRGGYLNTRGIQNLNQSLYRTTNSTLASTKGEGVAGTPRFMWDGYNEVAYPVGWQGYPGGDYGRGAPGNAGGGGNVHNAGGGGGGNGAAGGMGGYGWANSGPHELAGGRGGAAMPHSFGRFFMGGGGGAGDANNALSGVKGGVGGGIVIITANRLAGTGAVLTNGGRGEAGREGSSADGAGGGGAGGTIFLNISSPSPGANVNIQARGGSGGHAFTTTAHGPGGGGGGGVVYYHAPAANITTTIVAGQNGRTNDGAGDPHGSTSGAAGFSSSYTPDQLPPYLQGNSSTCYPTLEIRKSRTNPTVPIPAGSTITYVIEVENVAGGGAQGVTVYDQLSDGFSFVSATVEYSTALGSTENVVNAGTPEEPQLGPFNIPGGVTVFLKMMVNVPGTTSPGIYHNPAQITFLDPSRDISNPNRTVSPVPFALLGENTSYISDDSPVSGTNYDLNQPNEDVIVVAPDISIVKGVDNPCLDPVNGAAFTITVRNEGDAEVTDIVVEDILPVGLELNGTITAPGWSISVSGSTYTFEMASLAGNATANDITIPVRMATGATESSWANQATVTGGASSVAMLYAPVSNVTAQITNLGTICNDGTFYISGNVPDVGVGEWTFVGDAHGARIASPNQPSTIVSDVPVGELVEVRWTVSNGDCSDYADLTLENNTVLPTAIMSGGGEYCQGASRPAITVSLTGDGARTFVYLDAEGLEYEVTTNDDIYTIIPTLDGVYRLISVSATGTPCSGTVSGNAIITQNPQSVGGLVSGGGAVCSDELPGVLVLSGQVGYVESWEFSTDGGSTWSNVPDSEGLVTYQPAILSQTTSFRASVKSGSCDAVYSDEAAYIVTPVPTANAGTDITKYDNAVFSLSATNDVGTGGWSIVSSTPAGLAISAISDVSNPNATVTLPENSSAVLRWTVTNGSCVASDDVEVTYIVPSLSFAKTGVLSADGNTIEYTFTVTNTGDVTMTGIEATDVKLPGGTVDNSTGTWPSTEGVLAPGESVELSATYTVTQPEKNVGEVENTAAVTGTPPTTDPGNPAGPIDPVPSTPDVDNPGTPGDPGLPTVVNVPADPSLSFAKTGVLSVDGNTIEYTFTVTNTGNVTMTDIEAADGKLPGGTVDNSSGAWPSTEGVLAPGESVELSATYTATQPEKDAGSVENDATVTGTPPFDPADPTQPGDPITPIPSTPDVDNPGTPGDPGVPTVVEVPADPSLSFAKTGVLSVDGNTIEYTFTVTNTGNVTMTDIEAADGKLPGGTVDNSSGAWPSTEGVLAPRESVELSATYTVTQPEKDAGNVENAATVTGTPPFDPADPTQPGEPITPVPSTPDVDNPGTPGDPGVPTVVEVPADPALSFAKTGVLSTDGNTIEYTFTVTNTGNVTMTDIEAADVKLPGGTVDNSTGTWPSTEGVLAPGESVELSAIYTITQPEKDAGNVENAATVTGTPPFDPADPTQPGEPIIPVPSTPDVDNPGTPGDPGVPTVVEVPADPALSFAKTGVLSTDGNTIEYTFTVTNTGNVTMTDIEATDVKLPGGTVDNNSGTWPSTEGVLAPREFVELSATYTVTQPEKDAGNVENAAAVTGTPPFDPADPTQPGEPIDPVPSTPDVDNPGTPGDPGIPTVVEVPAEPALSFAKTGVLSTDGNTIEYTFTVTNTGNVTMEDIAVSDPKITDPIVLDATTLAPGQVATGTATYTVTQPEKDAGNVENNATVTGTPPFDPADPTQPGEPIDPVPSTPDVDNPGTPGDPVVPTVVEVPADPSLSFVKTGVLSTDGNTIEYTFTVTNTGNVTIEAITVSDPKITEAITVTPITLAPGQVATGTATYVITQAEKDAGNVENAATVTGTPPFDPADPTQPGEPIIPVPSTPDVDNPGTPGDPGVPTVVNVPADPSLSFAKTGVLSTDGNTIEYTFTVTNTGNVTMEDIGVTDLKITDPIVLDVTALAPGESTTGTATYVITQAEKDAGNVENAATVTGTPPFDPADPTQPGEPIIPVPSTPDVNNPGTPGDPGIPTVVDVPADPALSFAKTGVLSADGNTIEYTFTVTNTGNVTMTDIAVSDPKITDPIVLTATALAPGESTTGTATYVITQAEKDAGNVENTATVTGTPPFDPADPTQPGEPITPVPSTPDVDNPGTPGDPGVPTMVDVPADPSLSFAKTGVLSADGNTIEYTFTVTNTGNVTMEDITVSDPKITEAITMTPTTLAPGQVATGTATYTITQTEKDAGNVENDATVTGTPPFDPADPTQPGEPITPVPSTPDTGNPGTPGDPGVPTVVDVPADPSLSFAKTGVLSTDGNTIEYTFTVTNTGNVTMADITVSDPKISDPIVLTGTTLAPGESTTGTATYVITQAEKDAGNVENNATVTGTPPFDPADPTQPGEPITPVPSTPDVDNPGTPGDPGVPTVVDFPMTPSLALTKAVTSEGPYAINEYIDYEIVIHNTGNVTMINVTVTDNNAEIVSGSPLASLAPNATARVIARHQVTQADLDAGLVANQAKVIGNDPEGNPIPEVPSDNPDTPQPNDPTVVELTQRPGLALTKHATGEGPYVVGQYINFEIMVTNTGNVTLTDVTVTDNNADITAGSPVARLAPNATATVIARHQVTQADLDAGIVVNQAKVTGNDPEGDPIPEMPSDNPDTPQPNDPTVVELTQQPSLSLNKRAMGEGPYAVGDDIDYEIVVRNTGNVTLTGVTVTDNNAEITAGSPIASLVPNATATVIARHQVTQADLDAGTVVNQAKVAGNDTEGNPIPEVPSDNPETPQPNDPTVVELTQQPSFALTKHATGEGPYTLGQFINYEITVRNTGNVTLTEVAVTDDNAEISAGSPVARLVPNTAATVIARHQITQADLDAGTVVNQAKVTGNDPEGNPMPEVPSDNPDTPQPNDPTVVELTQQPDLALAKRATGEGPYVVGQYINFEIMVTNTGNVTLTDVTVTDDNADITAGSPVARLVPKATATVIARHQVTQADIDAGLVVNQAKVIGNDPEGNPIPEVPSDNPDTPQPNDPTVVELTQQPGLALTKSATSEGPYALGQYIDYEITVRNTGNVTLTDVVVTDGNAEITAGTPIANLIPNATATVLARHQVTQADLDAGVIVNQAKVTGNDPEGNPMPEVPSDNPDTPQPNDPTVVELTQRPGLALTKHATGEGPYTLGQYINFEIMVTNTGNVTLTGVTVTDNNADITAGSPVARLAPKATATVIARHQITQSDIDAGTVVNQAKVTGNDPEGNPMPEVPSDNPDTPQPNDPTVVELVQRTSLSLTKRATGEGPYTLGEYIDYEITVRNTGNVTLTDVTVTDNNAEITAGSPIARLAPNATATVIARHQIAQSDIDAGTVVNQATVIGDDPEGNPIPETPSDNPDTPQPNDPTVVELVQRTSLSLTKRVTSDGPYAIGEYINYELTVRNTGNVTLTDVTVTDNNAEITAGSPVTRLAPNATVTVIARHQITQSDIDAGTVVNQAKVTGNDPEGNPIPEVPSNNPDTPQPNDPTVVELTQQPNLALTKRATSEGPYAVGGYINYEITVRNTGNVTLTEVTVTDDNAEITGGTPIASLAPNATATVIAHHQITQADINAGTVVNQAKVTGNDPDGNPISEVPSDDPDTPQPNDPTVVELTQQPGLALTKRATSEGPYAVGRYINYEITVRNTGNVTLTAVTVTDNNAEITAGTPIANLAPNATATVTARHQVTQADVDAGTVVNQAKVIGNDPDGNPIPEVPSDNPGTSEPNDPTVVYLEGKPALSLTKGVTSEGPYDVGDQIKYFNIVVTNTGNVTLTDVIVTDDNAEIIAGSPVAKLMPGESASVMAQHVVTQADVDAGKVINQARVSGNDPSGNRTPEFLSDDPNTPEPGDETITAVAQAPGIRIDKVADRQLVEKAGDRIVYQLQVTNTGNVTLHDVEITDPLTGFVQQIAQIKPGVANAHTFRTAYVTTAADLAVGKIINTATVTALAPDGSEVTRAATVEIEAYFKEIEVEDDDFGPVNGKTGGDAGNVFTNDKVNGEPLVPGEVTLTRVPSDDPSPLTLEADGTVTVAPNTPAGPYSFDYQVCDIINPNNCGVATVTVVVAPAEIQAIDDQVTGVNGYEGTSNVTNVFANDQLNGAPIVPEEVTLTLVNSDPALQLNPDGSVDVAPGTRGGTYTLEYQICEKLNPDNCSVAIVTVTVVNPLKIPNVFTPNGDGRNDQFEIIGSEGFDRIELTIVNRWGNEVYRNDHYQNDWSGQGLTEGTYYYLITTHLGSTKEVHKGWVLIKRL